MKASVMIKSETRDIPRLIMGIGHHLKLRLDKRLSQNNLTISQFKVLAYLWEHHQQKVNQKQIHDFLEIKPSSMTKLIRLLQAKDLIQKEVDPDDPRNKIIKITAAGMEIKKICLHHMKQSENYLLKDFSEQEMDTFYDLLLRIKEKIRS
jgi:DNA-binding MarR family transcriptional regulator